MQTEADDGEREVRWRCGDGHQRAQPNPPCGTRRQRRNPRDKRSPDPQPQSSEKRRRREQEKKNKSLGLRCWWAGGVGAWERERKGKRREKKRMDGWMDEKVMTAGGGGGLARDARFEIRSPQKKVRSPKYSSMGWASYRARTVQHYVRGGTTRYMRQVTYGVPPLQSTGFATTYVLLVLCTSPATVPVVV